MSHSQVEPSGKHNRMRDHHIYSGVDLAVPAPNAESISALKGIECQCRITWRTLYDILVMILLLYCTVSVSYLLHQHHSESCSCQYSSSAAIGDSQGDIGMFWYLLMAFSLLSFIWLIL